MTQTPERIREKISEAVVVLAPHLRAWVEEHLIVPRQVRLALDANGTSFKNLWLVTNHVGANDSSYRVAYDDETDAFGLECTLDSGVEWYMGNYGSFAETIENM
jgi:hypothetical protein